MRTSRSRRSWSRLLVRGGVVLGAVALLLALAGTIVLATLPDVGDAQLRVARLLRAHQGRALGLPVPARIGQAVVAIEDERFYRHHGIDLVGLLRAGYVDLTTGARQGGSTITQQLANPPSRAGAPAPARGARRARARWHPAPGGRRRRRCRAPGARPVSGAVCPAARRRATGARGPVALTQRPTAR